MVYGPDAVGSESGDGESSEELLYGAYATDGGAELLGGAAALWVECVEPDGAVACAADGGASVVAAVADESVLVGAGYAVYA